MGGMTLLTRGLYILVKCSQHGTIKGRKPPKIVAHLPMGGL